MKQYIIDKNVPNIGSCESILRPDGSVMYTEFKSFEEYQAAHPEKEFLLITEEEMMERYVQSLDDLQEPYEEITEEKFYDILGCVPPKRHKKLSDRITGSFFCGEPYSGPVHGFYLYDKELDKFFYALRSITLSDEELINDYLKGKL